MAISGDAMDVYAFTKGPKGALKRSGKKTGLGGRVLVLRERVIEIPNFARSGKINRMSKDCTSKESSAFEAGDELAETGCIEMASIHLNATEIGAVQPPEEDQRFRFGMDSCAAVTVFPKSVAHDYPMLRTPGEAKSYRPASGKFLPDLGARQVQV